jgi:Fic family protein
MISSLAVELPTDLLALVDDASAEVARFDQEVGHEIAPFATVLLRSESAASSKIEHLTASARAIAEAELGGGKRNAALIVANQRAMMAAIALADHIDGDAILAMHAALLESDQPEITGNWRQQQVWIGGSDFGPQQAAFVPPHHRHLPELIEDLVEFIARDDIPVLAHVSLAHAQFETIHPFPDGNGRTGRALVHAQLRNKRLTRRVTVPISAGLLSNVDSYFAALTAYRLGDPTAIIERFSEASFGAVGNGRRLVDDLRGIRDDWKGRIRARRDARAWQVAELLVRHPVVNASLIAEELGIAPPNVYRIIQPLVDAEALVEFTNRKRDRLWRAPEVLAAVDGFAARAGRRQVGSV